MLACVVLKLGTIIYTVLTFCSLRHYRVTQLKEMKEMKVDVLTVD